MLDSILWLSGLAAEMVLILVLTRDRAYRTLPAFFFYLCFSVFCDASFLAIRSFYPLFFSEQYLRLYELQLVIDAGAMFAVLVELAWSILRPIRSSLPRGSWVAIAILIAVIGLLVWPVAGMTLPATPPALKLAPEGLILFRLQQTFAILRVIIFLGMAGFSNLLSIGWRNRELQLATGLGLYSIVSLAVTVMHTHQLTVSPQYHWLDQAASLSYLGALAYWVLAFATKEAERQDFTPQMVKFLLLVGGTAKAGRVALNDSMVTKIRPRNDQ